MRRGMIGGQQIPDNPNNRRQWEDYDPRQEEYYSPKNLYTSGPGLYLPPGEVPYSIRNTGVPVKLFVSGIQPYTTEEGVTHVFSNYGHPLNVRRTRNKYNQPIAFVEFRSTLEADNAIVALDNKPPLNWQVSYAIPRVEDRTNFNEMTVDSDLERQTPMFATAGAGPVQRQPPFSIRSSHFIDTQPRSADPLHPAIDQTNVRFTPCEVCGKVANHVCTVCKTRYCSSQCQSADWPTHKRVCKPPPALEQVNNGPSSQPTRSVYDVTNGNQDVAMDYRRGGPPPPFSNSNGGVMISSHQAAGFQPRAIEGNRQSSNGGLISPQDYTIRGIKPIEGSSLSVAPRVQQSAPITRNLGMESTKIIVTSEGRRVLRESITDTQIVSSRPESRSSSTGNFSSRRDVCISTNESVTPPRGKIQTNGPKSVMPQPSFSNSPSPLKNYVSSRVDGGNSTVPKVKGPRNLPLANYSPRSSIPSPSHIATPVNTTVDKVYAKEFTTMKLKPPVNGPAMVTVCFSKSPVEFYVQFECFREKLDEMMATIQKCVSSAGPILNPFEGMPCLAVFTEDRQWYRAVVITVFENGKNPSQLGVRFVDFGNTAKMPNTAEHFRMMELHLSEYPFFACPVRLPNVRPLSGSHWQDDVKLRFKELTENNSFMAEFIDLESGFLGVRLKTQTHQDLATYLVQKNLALSTSTPLVISDELDSPPANAAELPRTITVASPDVSKQTIEKQVTPPKKITPVPQESIKLLPPSPCAPTAGLTPTRAATRDAPSSVSPRAPVLPVAAAVRPKTPSAVTTSPLPSKSNSVLEFLTVGETFLVTTHLQKGHEEIIGSLSRHEEDIETLASLDSFLDTVEYVPSFKPPVGAIVAAFSKEHNVWFRACVTKIVASTFTVLYIDFGNFEEGIEQVKPVPSSLKRAELAIRLTFGENPAAEVQQFIDNKMMPGSATVLEVISKEKDGSVLVKPVEENGPAFVFKMESWKSLITSSTPKVEILPVKWETGFSCVVLPVVADDVDRIFVQVVSNDACELLEVVGTEVAESFAKSPKLSTVPAVGSYVASIFPADNTVYRAQVEEVNGESIKVSFIDYGNSEIVSLSDLRELPENLLKYPTLCNRIALARVNRPAGPLPPSLHELLQSCVGKVFNLMVLPSSSGLTECTLTENGELFNEKIADAIELLKKDSTTEVLKTTPTSVPMTMPLLEEAELEFEPPKEEVKVDNTLGRFVYDDGPFLELPVGKPFQALILYPISPQLFFISEKNDITNAKLEQLEEDMAAYANGIALGPVVEVNLIYIVRYPDGKWYRAACIEAASDGAGNAYGFIQVDRGHTYYTTVDNIRRIPARFINYLPFQSHQAMLAEVENMSDVSMELTNRFKELLTEKPVVTAEIVKSDVIQVIRLPEISAILSQELLI